MGFLLHHVDQQNHDTYLNYDQAREQKPENIYSQNVNEIKVFQTNVVDDGIVVYNYFMILTYADLRVFSCHSFMFVLYGSSHIDPTQAYPEVLSPPSPHHHENESATYPASNASKDASVAS